MAGPNSAPNGDRTLTDSTPFACETHGANLGKCSTAINKAIVSGKELPNCKRISKREFLFRSNRLYTGKTVR